MRARVPLRLLVLGFVTVVLAILVTSTAAFATDGRTAVGMCIDSTASGARCGWSVNDKGEIDICNKSGCVYCASAESQCVIAAVSRPRPKFGLPAGTTLTTKMGTFTVTPREFSGSLLKAPATQNKQ